MQMGEERLILETKTWIEELVIYYNLCPFAKLPFSQDRIRYKVSEEQQLDRILEDFAKELTYLSQVPAKECETTLLILPNVFPKFLDFWDFVGLAEEVMEEWGFQEQFQLASFHPQYQFAGTHPKAAQNYTNRSPYPMLHLLRVDSVALASDHYKDIDLIPSENINKLEAQPSDFWQSLLDRIKKI